MNLYSKAIISYKDILSENSDIGFIKAPADYNIDMATIMFAACVAERQAPRKYYNFVKLYNIPVIKLI